MWKLCFLVSVLATTFGSMQSGSAQGTPARNGTPPIDAGPPPDVAATLRNSQERVDAVTRRFRRFHGLDGSGHQGSFTSGSGPDINALSPFNEIVGPLVPPAASRATVSVDGITYDCIPVVEQPSLAPRPLLSPLPSTPPTPAAPTVVDIPPTLAEVPDGAISDSVHPPSPIVDTSPRCGAGTVPIRRSAQAPPPGMAQRQDFISKDHSLSNTIVRPDQPPTPAAPVPHRYAHASIGIENRGIRARLNVWNPRVLGRDMTLSQTWIVASYPDGIIQTVESGWQVWHGWGSDRPVPFLYYTADDYGETGCYNVSAECNAFVLVWPAVFLGHPLPASGVVDGVQPSLDIVWFLKPNGNWWVRMNGNWLGYYPKETFNGGPLPLKGQVLDVGGEATGTLPSSEMGSGRHAYLGFRHAAYEGNLGYYDAGGFFVEFKTKSPDMGTAASDPECYSISFAVKSSAPASAGLHFFFGGPGNDSFGGNGGNAKCQGPEVNVTTSPAAISATTAAPAAEADKSP